MAEKAVRIIDELGGEVATPKEARKFWDFASTTKGIGSSCSARLQAGICAPQGCPPAAAERRALHKPGKT